MKLKTHKGTAKRVKVTRKGKLMFNKAAHRHLLINKTKRQKKFDAMGHAVHKTDVKKIKRLLTLA